MNYVSGTASEQPHMRTQCACGTKLEATLRTRRNSSWRPRASIDEFRNFNSRTFESSSVELSFDSRFEISSRSACSWKGDTICTSRPSGTTATHGSDPQTCSLLAASAEHLVVATSNSCAWPFCIAAMVDSYDSRSDFSRANDPFNSSRKTAMAAFVSSICFADCSSNAILSASFCLAKPARAAARSAIEASRRA